MQSFERLIDFTLGGEQHPTRVLIEDCYDILGYGLGQALPAGVPEMPLMAMVQAPDTRDEQAIVLRQAVLGGADAIPWQTILPLVKLLLDQLWNRLFG
jgi:hypothetical protein